MCTIIPLLSKISAVRSIVYLGTETSRSFETWPRGDPALSQAHTYTFIFQMYLCWSFAQTKFFAMSTEFNVSVKDLRQCRRRRLLRQSCFLVLPRQVFSLCRTENVRVVVSDAIQKVTQKIILPLRA